MANHDSTVRLAVAAVGAVNLAVAVEAVMQAIPLKGALTPLPRRQGALCGVAEHSGQLVPVVDLARWVDVGAAQADGEPAERIMMLSDGRRTIGLKVDTIRGLTDVAPQTFSKVHHDADSEEVFHTVVKSDDMGLVLSILDVGRLIDLASAWHEHQREREREHERDAGAPDAQAQSGGGQPAAGQQMLGALLGVGDARVALPAAELAEVIALPELLAVGTAGSNRYCKWRDRTIAVINLAALLGQPDPRPGRLLAIVQRDGLTVGLMVDEAIELRSLNIAAQAVAGAVASTVFEDGVGAIQVIDTAALFANTPEASISKATTNPAREGGDAQRANTGAYIVFQTDQAFAAPIDAMEEILPLRAEHLDGAERLSASIEWRGKAIRLTDLRAARGVTPTPAAKPTARIIVMRGADGYAGYVVRHVLLLIPPHTGWLYRMALAGAGPVEFITTGQGSERVSYRTVDLANRP
jgi:chemotaxis signal transduction protein